jgi:ubiquinone/menaquinone biosynthesis C-methylase UbiE
MKELRRVLKPGGRLLMIAEMYRDGTRDRQNVAAMKLVGGSCLSLDEHRKLFTDANFVEIQVFTNSQHGWLCTAGKKPE